MDAAFAIAILALLVSVVSAYFSWKTLGIQINVSKNAALVAQSQNNEQRLTSDPALLALHGVNLDRLKEDGLTPTELIYILSDLRQGEVVHRMESRVSLMMSDYRQAFLRQPKVQTAFTKHIDRRLISDGPYVQAVRNFIRSGVA